MVYLFPKLSLRFTELHLTRSVCPGRYSIHFLWNFSLNTFLNYIIKHIFWKKKNLNSYSIRPLHDSKQNGNILLEIRENGQVPTRPVPTRPVQYRQSTCSTFTKPYLVNQPSKPAQVGQPGNHRLVSRTGDSELDTVAMKSSTVYKENTNINLEPIFIYKTYF